MEGKRGSTLIFHIYFGLEDNTRSLNHRRITKSVFDQRPEDTHHRCRIVMFLFTAYGLLHLSSKRVFSSIKHKKSKTLFERIKTV